MGRKSTNQTPSRNNQVDTIDLVELGRALLFHWKLILAAMVLCGGIAYIYCRFFVTPVFSSTAGLYVFSKSTSVTSLADLQIGSSLTKDYETVITSRPILDRVITRLNLEADYKTLRRKIDISNPSDSRILYITAKDPNPELAKEIADRTASIASTFISQKMDQDPPSIIQAGYTDEALALLKQKKKGGYNIVQIDPDYLPPEKETKQVFGVTFEQGHNFFRIDRDLLSNVVTEKKDLPEEAVRDLIVALITLKYTQSNSVCYAHDGQAIGVGAGQQSRVHCTRLAGGKADTWFLRMHDKVLNLPFKDEIRRPDRDNVIDAYINKNEEDCCAEGVWQKYFTEQPEYFTDEEQRAYLDSISGVSCGSDAFFPFFDNVQRAAASGVSYIAQPGGSIRDDAVIDCCNKLGIAMAFTGMRLFHH